MLRRFGLLALLGPALAGFSPCSEPPGPQQMTIEECAAPDVELFGVNIDPGNPTARPTPDALHELGVRWVRFVYRAGTGVAATRAQIDRYRSAGIKVLLNVCYEAVGAAKPAHDAPASEWSAYTTAFVAAARDVATGIGSGVDAYEVWNEPDQLPEEGRDPSCSCDVSDRCDDGCGCDYQCYDPYVPAQYFGPMANQAGTLLAATGVPIVLGGFSSGQPSYLTATLSTGGGLPQYGAIGVHPYGADWLPGHSLANAFATYAAGGRQVWVSEIGLEVDGQDGADYLRHVYSATVDGGYAGSVVPVIFWFAWSDGNRPGFGLVDIDGKPKATYAAYQELAPAAHGRCRGGGAAAGCPQGQHAVGGVCLADGCGDGVCAASETVDSCGRDCGCAVPDACGTLAPFGCYCDAECTARGDCCSDYDAVCGG